MLPAIEHAWDISPSEAIDLQIKLSKKVVRKDRLGVVNRIAGIDVAYHKNNDTLVASIVIVDAHSLETIESHAWAGIASYPYVPGLFRLENCLQS